VLNYVTGTGLILPAILLFFRARLDEAAKLARGLAGRQRAAPKSRGVSDLSFGFNILNERGQPILWLSFRTRDDAAQARAEIAKAVAKAVGVARPALTAAGEP
jgi:hypothetical protein